MSNTKQPATKPLNRWRDKDGVWHQEELPAQPIRELPPRKDRDRKSA